VKQYTPPGQDASERNTTFQGFNAVTEIVGQAALDGDTLVVGTSHIGDDESPGGFLVALDAAGSATNFVSRVKWTFPVDDFVWSTPVVSDGVAYFTSLDKHVYAVDLSDDIVNAADRLIWRFEAEGALTAKPLIVNGMLYVGDLRGNFYALDLQARARTSAARALDPATEWRAETNAWVWAPAIEEGGVIYVSTLAGTVHAFDALSGTVRWAEPAKIDGQIVAAPLLIDGPTRPSGRARDRLLAVPSGSDDVWVLDALTGQDLGKFATEGGVKASPAATGNTLYVHTLKRQLQWFSLQDRALLGCVKLNNGEDCR
jgi:outer membrane protein assembly factor BamB